MNASSAIRCEIVTPGVADAAALAEVATLCARELHQPLAVETLRVAVTDVREPVLTLHLPVALASSQHRIWCLACRLAVSCPGARVSVLVHGENAFASAEAAKRRRSA
ncbi:MAG TPA: hypothetical protein VNR00_15445 [Opitutus sp.]|nr:hypothetical protein [Opitutus sp.]